MAASSFGNAPRVTLSTLSRAREAEPSAARGIRAERLDAAPPISF